MVYAVINSLCVILSVVSHYSRPFTFLERLAQKNQEKNHQCFLFSLVSCRVSRFSLLVCVHQLATCLPTIVAFTVDLKATRWRNVFIFFFLLILFFFLFYTTIRLSMESARARSVRPLLPASSISASVGTFIAVSRRCCEWSDRRTDAAMLRLVGGACYDGGGA